MTYLEKSGEPNPKYPEIGWSHMLLDARGVAEQVQTEMMGDIHHFAWRARHRNQTVYLNKRDAERFGDWASEDCNVRGLACLRTPNPLHICPRQCMRTPPSST